MSRRRLNAWRKDAEPYSRGASSRIATSASRPHTPDNENGASSSAAAESQPASTGSTNVHRPNQEESSGSSSGDDQAPSSRWFPVVAGRIDFPRRAAPADAIHGDFEEIVSIHSSDEDYDGDESGHGSIQGDAIHVNFEEIVNIHSSDEDDEGETSGHGPLQGGAIHGCFEEIVSVHSSDDDDEGDESGLLQGDSVEDPAPGDSDDGQPGPSRNRNTSIARSPPAEEQQRQAPVTFPVPTITVPVRGDSTGPGYGSMIPLPSSAGAPQALASMPQRNASGDGAAALAVAQAPALNTESNGASSAAQHHENIGQRANQHQRRFNVLHSLNRLRHRSAAAGRGQPARALHLSTIGRQLDQRYQQFIHPISGIYRRAGIVPNQGGEVPQEQNQVEEINPPRANRDHFMERFTAMNDAFDARYERIRQQQAETREDIYRLIEPQSDDELAE
ncbi:hypothetical protein DHEL01_v211754 [Diaporthe helianthi]|uniref:Uncharacterized protein n=1 Tax=Diaporthe helianthi TaxID=158607 RepID=A0A2P5HHW8_DIAHE|nr:hypothetical protein DHEL01_v211754 [Diaporthe helianthi]